MRKTTQGKVLTAMHTKGALIMVETNSGSVNGKTYRLSTTNQWLDPKLVENLIGAGLIKSGNDGLPGFGEAQTYHLARDLT